MSAQSGPAACPADRPVDDIIAEIHSQQSNKKNRNTNPLPTVTCIFGWCRDNSRTPPAVPPPAPHAETPTATNNDSDTGTTSSSKDPKAQCNDAMERALEAARDVDVGDYSFNDKNYRGALMRYQDAVNWKPQDSAIHVRLGRVYEKLNQVPQAIEQYTAAGNMTGPQKWTNEAKTALQRLQPK